jgi:heparin/heparan-sulfate lyase
MSFPFSVTAQLKTGNCWKEADGIFIPLPPGEHPRLYLREDHARQMGSRLNDSILKPVVERLRSQAARSPQLKIEWDALQYLVSGDPRTGRIIIDSALALLKRTELPEKQDAARVTGRMMVTGAIVYDWLYDLLTPEDKSTLIAELVRLAKTLECGYPPVKQGSVTGHSSESFVMRDMLSAGIAIYDEFPEMYNLAAVRFFREHLPVRNWFYNGHAYHQGDSYGPHRFHWDTYPLFIFDRMGYKNVYNPEQQYVPYIWIYTTRPDGQRMRAGDTFATSNPRGRPWGLYHGTVLTASYYNDGFLLDQYLKQGGSDGNENIFEALWRDITLQRKPVETLPLTHYSGSPFGWMAARTGWDEDAVIAEMKINEYNFSNHQHLDAGSFQIYYRGILATESGIYEGTNGAYGSAHCTNYYWRTIAHNSLLVYDPQEKFTSRKGWSNDGGQRLPNDRNEPRNLKVLLAPEYGYRTGKIIASGFGPDLNTPDYSYLKGDITAAYSSKAEEVKRTFTFLNLKNKTVPAALIIYDKVVSSSPSFKKFWLLHSIEEPAVNGNEVTITRSSDGYDGKLLNTTLLPVIENTAITPVGGQGKEHWVFGENYGSEPRYGRSNSYERAAWRIELSPKKPASEDYFLNVMQVMKNGFDLNLKVKRIEGEKIVGVLIADRIVIFSKSSEVLEYPFEFSVGEKGIYKILLTDLLPGPWQVLKEDKAIIRTVQVSSSDGICYFEGTEGKYTLKRPSR